MKWPLLGHKTGKRHSRGRLPYFLFTPRGKVENFGTFPGSHFPPKESSGRICQLGELEQWVERPAPGTGVTEGQGPWKSHPQGREVGAETGTLPLGVFSLALCLTFWWRLKTKESVKLGHPLLFMSKLRQNLQIFPRLLLLLFYTFSLLYLFHPIISFLFLFLIHFKALHTPYLHPHSLNKFCGKSE